MRVWGAVVLVGCSFSGTGSGTDDGPGTTAGDANGDADVAELGPFGEPRPLALAGADPGDDDPSLTADELELYFNAYRGALTADIWVATRAAASESWGTPSLVVELSSTANETTPEVSADGLTLFFASDRPGSRGSYDIWMSTRASRTDAWTTPVPVDGLSSAAMDASPGTSDGLAVPFTSDRDGGGDPDVFLATRADAGAAWSPWAAVDAINLPGHEGSCFLSLDRLWLYFDSDRDGTLHLFATSRSAPTDPFPAAKPLPGLVSTWADQDPWMSPDRRHVVFWSNRNDMPGLWEARR